jgi:chitinase
MSRACSSCLALACLLLLRATAVLGAVETAGGAQPNRIVAYVEEQSLPAVIHTGKLTHINYSFAHIGSDGRVKLESAAAADSMRRLVGLKRKQPGLQVIVSVGGWAADGFSDAALTDASRDRFAASAVELIRQYGLDGVDIDWEYPGQGADAGIKYRPEDRRNFTLLLKTLREKLDAGGKPTGKHYVLTIASADREYFDHTEMDRLHVYLDWINVMAYDFFNSLTPTTGHHAGLYAAPLAAPTDRNADTSIRQHLAAGIPASKLVLGVAFYGRGFSGVRARNNGVNQPYERFEDYHPYSQLLERFIGRRGFTRYWDERAQAPYLWNVSTRTFISYDDPQSIAVKAAYVKDHHLGGMMFWALGDDRHDELLDAIDRSLRQGGH